MMGGVRSAVALAGILLASPAAGELPALTIGGAAGRPWHEVAQKWVALDDTVAAPALQPKELRPNENIVAGRGLLTNIFGFQWHRGKSGMEATGKEMGLHPRIWNANDSETVNEVFDGDPNTFKPLAQLVPTAEYSEYSTATSSGSEFGIFRVENELYTLDFGITVPLTQVRFYPPQHGIGRGGVPYKDTAPQGFQVSAARYPQDYLLLGTEAAPWHTLDHVLARTLANSSSVVEVDFQSRFLRFVRIDLSLMPQYYSLAEIEAYGKGVPDRAYLISGALDLSQPVNLGRVLYAASTLQRGADDELAAAPEALTRMVLETRSGSDDTPLSYYVVDELGRDVEVTQRQYERADPPRIDRTGLRLPGMRGPITDDTDNWTAWSSPYSESGQQNRAADGRRYLQFRLSLETDDPSAFVRVDSLAFEYSTLLVREAVGEVSLQGEPGLAVVEVAAGDRHQLVYDLRARFDAAAQRGFDGVWIHAPPGSRFTALEMGDPLAPVAPDSVAETDAGLGVYFPAHRVTATRNAALRIHLEAPLLSGTMALGADLLDTQGDELPQSVDAGNATDAVASNSLQVYATQPRLSPLADLAAAPGTVTPNGDGINDAVSIRFTVLGVEWGDIQVAIHALDGRGVAEVQSGQVRQGLHQVLWDGTGADGHRVCPGVYLCRVSLETESGTTQLLQPLAVVY